MSELHLFVVWEKARQMAARIEEDLMRRLQVVAAYEVHWPEHRFSANLSRFYGKNLPPGSRKESVVGRGPFLAYVVKDAAPEYVVRATSNGEKLVNRRIFDAKMMYRQWTTPGEKIHSTVHATNNVQEAKTDLMLLTGKPYASFAAIAAGSDRCSRRQLGNLFGSDGFNRLEDALTTLGACCNYVVLRNFSNFFGQPISEEHSDIDLLVDDYEEARRLLNASEVFTERFRVHNKVSIAGMRISFDLRHVGDGYLDERWEQDILRNRILHEEGIYTPADVNYFYSLLYHALIHKRRIADNYRHELTDVGRRIGLDAVGDDFFDFRHLQKVLDCFMQENGYRYAEPSDLSVGFHAASRTRPTYLFRKNLYRIKKRLRGQMPQLASLDNVRSVRAPAVPE